MEPSPLPPRGRPANLIISTSTRDTKVAGARSHPFRVHQSLIFALLAAQQAMLSLPTSQLKLHSTPPLRTRTLSVARSLSLSPVREV